MHGETTMKHEYPPLPTSPRCTECRFHWEHSPNLETLAYTDRFACQHPLHGYSLVNWNVRSRKCEDARNDRSGNDCGPDATWFERSAPPAKFEEYKPVKKHWWS